MDDKELAYNDLDRLFEAHIMARVPLGYRAGLLPYKQNIIEGLRGVIAATQQPKCICGGEPHVSHCHANPDPFLKVNV